MTGKHKTIGCVLLVIGILLVALILIWCAGRYGWKLTGFKNTTGAGIEKVTIQEGSVTIDGFYPGSFPEGFIGYVARQEGNELYVGYRFSAIFGIFETGSFCITIPTEGTVTTVYTQAGTDIYQVWPR